MSNQPIFRKFPKLMSQNLFKVKVAEYVDIFVHSICGKFKNDRTKDNEYTRCTEMDKNIKQILRRISAFCISLFCYGTISKLLQSILRDTGKNLLVK